MREREREKGKGEKEKKEDGGRKRKNDSHPWNIVIPTLCDHAFKSLSNLLF